MLLQLQPFINKAADLAQISRSSETRAAVTRGAKRRSVLSLGLSLASEWSESCELNSAAFFSCNCADFKQLILRKRLQDENCVLMCGTYRCKTSMGIGSGTWKLDVRRHFRVEYVYDLPYFWYFADYFSAWEAAKFKNSRKRATNLTWIYVIFSNLITFWAL